MTRSASTEWWSRDGRQQAVIKTRNDREPISNGRLTVRKTQTERAAMKPATPSTLRPANGGATQDGKTELPPSTQLRKVVFGGTRFSLLCAASKKQFPVRTTCVTSLLPLLLLLTLPAAVQAQYNYMTNNGTITITGYTGSSGAVTIPSTINGLPVTSIGARRSLAAPA